MREAAKNVFFFCGPTTKVQPPSSLVVTFFGIFFLEFQKKFFFLSGSPLPSS